MSALEFSSIEQVSETNGGSGEPESTPDKDAGPLRPEVENAPGQKEGKGGAIKSGRRKAGVSKERSPMKTPKKAEPKATESPKNPEEQKPEPLVPEVGELEHHALANLFPMLAEEDFRNLVADIKENGLREPVVLYEGKILDGRNRERACRQLGSEHAPVEWDGKGTPSAFVVSKNVTRRHLNETQRALVAAKLRASFEEDAKKRMKKGAADPSAQTRQGKSAAEAAKLVNVGTRSVESASKVLENGAPELIAAVEAGVVKVTPAELLVGLSKKKQAEIVKGGRDTIRAAVKKAIAEAKAEKSKKTKGRPKKGAPTDVDPEAAEARTLVESVWRISGAEGAAALVEPNREVLGRLVKRDWLRVVQLREQVQGAQDEAARKVALLRKELVATLKPLNSELTALLGGDSNFGLNELLALLGVQATYRDAEAARKQVALTRKLLGVDDERVERRSAAATRDVSWIYEYIDDEEDYENHIDPRDAAAEVLARGNVRRILGGTGERVVSARRSQLALLMRPDSQDEDESSEDEAVHVNVTVLEKPDEVVKCVVTRAEAPPEEEVKCVVTVLEKPVEEFRINVQYGAAKSETPNATPVPS